MLKFEWDWASMSDAMVKFSEEDFAAKVVGLREQQGLTQIALGKHLGRSQGHIADIEGGRRKPSLKILVELSQVLETSVDYLLGITNDPSPHADLFDAKF